MRTRGRIGRAIFLVCALQATWMESADAHESPPTIDVLFEIAAEPFKANLSPQQREKVEIAMAKELVRLCSDPVAYFHWQEARTLGPRAALKVVLRAERARYGYEIFLQYISFRGSNETPWPRDPKYTVYQPYELSLPTHNPEQLEAAVRGKLLENFSNSDFCKLLHARLATTVPITETITFDAADQRCILPLSWESLQAADGSVLLASFQARSPQDSQSRPVQIRMVPEPWVNGLRCRVFEFRYPPTSLQVQRGQELRDPKIPESLRDKVGQVAVYMEEYVRDFRANTNGALNVTP